MERICAWQMGLALASALVSRGFVRLWHVPKAWARVSPRQQCGGIYVFEFMCKNCWFMMIFLYKFNIEQPIHLPGN